MKRALFLLLFFPTVLLGQNFISKLDSLIINNDNNTEIFAIVLEYNAYGMVQSALGYDRNIPGGMLMMRDDFLYNQSQQLISHIRINEFNINEFKKTYTYNSNGQLVLIEEFDWEVSTGTWDGGPKNEWIFDQNNHLITEIKYNTIFAPSEKINYTYLNNNCISKLVSEMGPVGWEKTDSLINYYINNNLIASVEYYNFTSSTPPSWQLNDSLEYTYGINGNNNTITSYSAIGFNNSWQLTTQEQLSYNLNGNRIQSIKFNCSITPWDTVSISEYSYDINNNILSYKYYEGILLHNETRIYNSSLMNTTAFPEILDENEDISLLSNNQIIERQFYFGNGANSIEYYFYSNFISSLIVDKSYLNNRKLLSKIDFLGRETKGKKNEPLLYLYDDGTVEKRITID